MEALITIKSLDGKVSGDYDFPEPSTYSSNTSTIVDSSRNVSGYVVASVIREDVSKVEISWRYLTVQQWARILSCFSEANNGKFIRSVRFFDQSKGDWITKDMYVSDRKANIFRRDPVSGAVIGWENPSLSLIEV